MTARCASLGSRPAAASLLLLGGLAGCVVHGAPEVRLPGEPGTEAPRLNGEGAEQPVGQSVAGGASASPAARPRAPLPGGEEPTPDKALPELHVAALGMHVGGGTNSAEEKAPFHHALEQEFPAFLECYRLADEPWGGGSFGVDLKIPRAGGGPAVEQPRTRIRGAGFRDCMLKALGQVQFARPKAGPTVISYSVRFTLGDGKP